MDTAEKIAQTVKETVAGVGEGTMHGLKVAAGMGSDGAQTLPTVPVSTETAIPVRESTMGREHPSSTEISSYLNAARSNEPQAVGQPMTESHGALEGLKENVAATGEKIKGMMGMGMEKGSEAAENVSETMKDAGSKASETIGEGLKSTGETTKHAGERATGER